MSDSENLKPNTPEQEKKDFLPPDDARAKDKKKMRNWWLKTLFMMLLIGGSVAIMFTIPKYLSPAGTLHIKDVVKGIDWTFFAILMSAVLLYIIVESGKYAFLLKISTKKFHFRTSVKTMFLGKYYDGITPLSTGGQPFQIYYLHKKHDVPKGVATAIPLVRYIVSASVITILSIALLIATPFVITDNETLTVAVLVVSWISLALNCMFPVAIILFSAYPNKTKRIIAGIIHLLYRMHIVKHKFLVMNKWLRELNEYSASIKMFAKKIKYAAPLVFLAIVECLINYSIPFFAVVAIAGPEAVPPTWELLVQILC
ncbi:MAG: flippase-like domain-containing protein, partial [Clostridiales bacterium]|nr:flippase-like domain-containing protein [Clostridiales bacterium]